MSCRNCIGKILSGPETLFEIECPTFRSGQISHSVMSDSLRHHEWQHTKPPCPSPTPRFTETYVHRLSDAILLVLCRPLLLLPSVFPSIRVFSNELTLHQETRVLELQPQHSSLPQHHSSKASIIWHSAFFIVQLSYPYMTTEKTRTLTRWTFVGKVMSLLFNMLSQIRSDQSLSHVRLFATP